MQLAVLRGTGKLSENHDYLVDRPSVDDETAERETTLGIAIVRPQGTRTNWTLEHGETGNI